MFWSYIKCDIKTSDTGFLKLTLVLTFGHLKSDILADISFFQTYETPKHFPDLQWLCVVALS